MDRSMQPKRRRLNDRRFAISDEPEIVPGDRSSLLKDSTAWRATMAPVPTDARALGFVVERSQNGLARI